MRRIALAALAALVLAASTAGCAGTVILLDRPDYHYQNGLRFLNEGKIDPARLEFEYALFLDANHVPALVGLALAQGASGNLDKALELLGRARALRAAQPAPGR